MKSINFANFQIRVEENFDTRNITIDDFSRLPEIYNKTTSFDNDIIYDINFQKIDSNFIWIYCKYGNPNPCPKDVFDREKKRYLDNKRSKNQVEMSNQLFALYCFKNNILYFNDSRKKKFLQDLFKELLNLEIRIVNIYMDIDKFKDKIQTLKSIKFTSSDNLLTQNARLNRAFRDEFGINEQINFTIEINANTGFFDKSVLGSIVSKLKLAKNQNHVNNIVLVGRDDKNFEEVFNEGSFIKKVEHYFSINNEGMVSPEEVKNFLVNRLTDV